MRGVLSGLLAIVRYKSRSVQRSSAQGCSKEEKTTYLSNGNICAVYFIVYNHHITFTWYSAGLRLSCHVVCKKLFHKRLPILLYHLPLTFSHVWYKSVSNYTTHVTPQIYPNTFMCKKFSLLCREPHSLLLAVYPLTAEWHCIAAATSGYRDSDTSS